MTRRVFGPALLAGLLLPTLSVAEDWPQWRGPNRDDISAETGLPKTWPSAGPRLAWTFEQAGNGYSGPAVVGDRLYSIGGRGDDATGYDEFVFAVDATNGKQVWSVDIAHYDKSVMVGGWGVGPRSTPTVAGGAVYALGGNSDLVCLDVVTGQKRWAKNLKKDLGGQLMRPGWGFSESPLVDGDKVICTPGGTQGTLAALDAKTGNVVWRSTEVTDPASYASVVVGNAGGVRQYVQLTGDGVVGVAPADGKKLWYYSKKGEYKTAVIPTAIVSGDYVFATAAYKVGCDLIKLTSDGAGGFKAEKVYSNKDMENHHGGVVKVGDYLYGYSQKGRGAWVCMEFLTGKIRWESTKLDKGSLTFADGQLYCYGEKNGTLVRAEANPAGWQETGRFTIPEHTKLNRRSGLIWTHPVIANGKLYLRDLDLLFCFDLTESRAAR
jgi:outer membrane protein assembly factor BamB